MDNTREKLIDLLRDCIRVDTEKKEAWIIGGKVGRRPSIFENMADHLIAEGVTFATDKNVGGKWIPVSERLPDKDGTYLVLWKSKSVGDAEYESRCGSFGYWLDIYWDKDAEWYPYVDITHWMQLPEPPKEE